MQGESRENELEELEPEFRSLNRDVRSATDIADGINARFGPHAAGRDRSSRERDLGLRETNEISYQYHTLSYASRVMFWFIDRKGRSPDVGFSSS